MIELVGERGSNIHPLVYQQRVEWVREWGWVGEWEAASESEIDSALNSLDPKNVIEAISAAVSGKKE